MIVAGIDPSLSNTAVVIGDGDKHITRAFPSKPWYSPGHISPDHVVNRMTRIEHLVAQITQFVESQGAAAIYLESYSFMSNAGRAQYVVEFGAILRWHLIDLRGIESEVHEIAPTTLKKFAAGKGNAKKDQVIARITKRFNVLLRSNDEYDAFALYQLGLVCEGVRDALTVAEREAANTVQGIRNPKRRKGDDPNQPILPLERLAAQ